MRCKAPKPGCPVLSSLVWVHRLCLGVAISLVHITISLYSEKKKIHVWERTFFWIARTSHVPSLQTRNRVGDLKEPTSGPLLTHFLAVLWIAMLWIAILVRVVESAEYALSLPYLRTLLLPW